jgi:hypothetical protein
VDGAEQLSEFLAGRRAKVTPEQVGLRSYGRRLVAACPVNTASTVRIPIWYLVGLAG